MYAISSFLPNLPPPLLTCQIFSRTSFFAKKRMPEEEVEKAGLSCSSSAFLSFFKRQEKENEKRIFSIFSFFSFLEEKKKGKKQRKRRVFKKRKMSGKSGEKAGIYAPGRYPSFAIPLSLKKERAPPFRTSEGSKTLQGSYLPFALPLSLRKKTLPPRKMRAEDAWTPKRDEVPEKGKGDGKAAKRQGTMSLRRHPLFVLLFPLKKEQRVEDPFPHTKRGRRPHPLTPPSFCLSFCLEKTDEEVAKKR